jgi:hypothetical protein
MLAQRYLSRLGIVPAPDPVQTEHLRLGQTTIPPLAADEGGYVDADDRGYQFLLDYRDRPGAFPRYSLSELLDGQIPPSVLTNKIVLLGSLTESLRDDFYIPLSAQHGLSRVHPDAPPRKPTSMVCNCTPSASANCCAPPWMTSRRCAVGRPSGKHCGLSTAV